MVMAAYIVAGDDCCREGRLVAKYPKLSLLLFNNYLGASVQDICKQTLIK